MVDWHSTLSQALSSEANTSGRSPWVLSSPHLQNLLDIARDREGIASRNLHSCSTLEVNAGLAPGSSAKIVKAECSFQPFTAQDGCSKVHGIRPGLVKGTKPNAWEVSPCTCWPFPESLCQSWRTVLSLLELVEDSPSAVRNRTLASNPGIQTCSLCQHVGMCPNKKTHKMAMFLLVSLSTNLKTVPSKKAQTQRF